MKSIYIKNARVNNLKNVSVEIPRNQLVVITGVSGSGKSSLAFDTLYAEGQRRYVESLSSYARQFLARMEKPDVDYIQGISPAMAIQQKVSTSNPRSTVGTTTEVYDYFKLLFARIGQTYSPISNHVVTSDSVSDIVDFIIRQASGSKVYILAKVQTRSKGYKAELTLTLQKGFSRILNRQGEIKHIEDLIENPKLEEQTEFTLLIDRIKLRKDDLNNLRARLADSIQTAYQEGFGECLIKVNDEAPKSFSEKFEMDGIVFERPSVNLFSFNNPYGACSHCGGFGRVLGVDENKVIPDKTKSVYEGAVAPWRGEIMGKYLKDFLFIADEIDFPIHKPYYQLKPEHKKILWDGVNVVWGINQFFTYIKSKSQKVQYRVMMARYRGYTTCPDCEGSRIRKDANYVKVAGYSISELLSMQLDHLYEVVNNFDLSETNQQISDRLLREISTRLKYLNEVGVGYLTLNRRLNTLSGGEMQRIRLATSLGSGLVGAMYILDEPSIGLHSRDTDKLIAILESLRNQGNTVIVVEHDESIMKKADQLIDIGPGAGELGGEIVFTGQLPALIQSDTLTAKYLSGKAAVELPSVRRSSVNWIKIKKAIKHNLKGFDVDIPLNAITVVTGVSGSGKTTLIQEVLHPALQHQIDHKGQEISEIPTQLQGDFAQIRNLEMVDQRPIGRSARSNPATYIKAYDAIRALFANQPLAKIKNLKAGSFSFNIDGGRCEECKGDGHVVVEMQFLPDVELLCDVCHGKRFKRHVLEVMYKDKNIDDVLNMTISEALSFFQDQSKIAKKLEVLQKVGLGYLRMGQSTSTLSGGEAQRMKLAYFLSLPKHSQNTFYIFDEPTTGLHFDDIRKLMFAFNELVERGNTVLVIEHNLDVIKCADWIIDLGPEGGEKGGYLLYQGSPEGLLSISSSYTAKYLKDKL